MTPDIEAHLAPVRARAAAVTGVSARARRLSHYPASYLRMNPAGGHETPMPTR